MLAIDFNITPLVEGSKLGMHWDAGADDLNLKIAAFVEESYRVHMDVGTYNLIRH
jgi:hypothetical protein